MAKTFSGTIHPIDLSKPQHADAVLALLDEYARDPMGDGRPLPDHVRQNLIPRLSHIDTFRGLLADIDGKFVGMAVCYLGFSTFKAKPLINIHDLCVSPEVRGQGVGTALLEAVDNLARQYGCTCVTLEVRADNRARNLYLRHGFDPGNPKTNAMSFWKKSLED